MKKAMTCKLTAPELQKRKEEMIYQLKTRVLEKKELADGYAYQFDGSDEMLDLLVAFIKSERLCCDFFEFRLEVGSEGVWLEMVGEEGVKGFIEGEMEM